MSPASIDFADFEGRVDAVLAAAVDHAAGGGLSFDAPVDPEVASLADLIASARAADDETALHFSAGGGLFDDQGRLVGLTTWKRIDSEGLNFAVPSEWIAHAVTSPGVRPSMLNSSPDLKGASDTMASASSLMGSRCPFDAPPVNAGRKLHRSGG